MTVRAPVHTGVFMLCSGTFRRGAIYWWRRRLRLATGESVVVAMSLSVTDPALARRLGEAMHMHAAAIAAQANNRREAMSLIGQYLDIARHDHEKRYSDDLEHARTLDHTARASLVENRISNTRIYAALYEAAADLGPVCLSPTALDQVESYKRLLPWEKSIVRDKIEKGFLAEIFRPGSSISGAPPRQLLEQVLTRLGHTVCDNDIAVQCGELARAISKILTEATTRYEEARDGLDAALAAVRTTPALRRVIAGISIGPPPFAAPDAFARGEFYVAEGQDGDFDVRAKLRDHALPDHALTFPKPDTCGDTRPPDRPAPALPPAPEAILVARADERRPTEEGRRRADPAPPPKPIVATRVEHIVDRPAPSPTSSTPDMTVSTLVEQLCERRRNVWAPKTQQQVRSLAALLIQFAGADDVNRLDQLTIGRFRDALDLLPKTYGKSAAARATPLTQIIESARTLPADERGLGPATIKRHLGHLRAILEAARGYGFTCADPASLSKMVVKDRRRDDEKRGVFTKDELTRLFRCHVFTDPHADISGADYWLPLLGAYTGARLGELAGLRHSDVDLTNAVINIRPHAERSVKTATSERLIPLHSELIRLGFADFVSSRSNRSEPLIFPELRSRGAKRDLSDTASRRFGVLLDRVLPDARNEMKTFHSLRSFVNTALMEENIPDALREIILGHKSTTTNNRHYIKNVSIKSLHEAIEKLPVITHFLLARRL